MEGRDLTDWWTRQPVRLLASLFLVAALISNVAITQAASTADVFVTDDGTIKTDSSGRAIFQNWQLEAASKAKESRPAHLDPEGNWGEPSSGMQMSIRLEKSTYKVGEPVNATIIVRNLDQKSREYRVFYPDERGFGLSLFAQGRAGPVLSKIDSRATNEFGKVSRLPITKVGHFWLSPATQQKHEVRLDRIYDLTRPSSYMVSASRDILDPDTGGTSLISTKFAAFEIVSGGGPDSRTNIQPGSVVSPPVLSPAGSGELRAIRATSFTRKIDPSSPVAESGETPPPPTAPSLDDSATAATAAKPGWTSGLLFAAIAAFVGSILWVLRRRSGRS